MSRETLYIFFILAKQNCHSSNSCQIDNINIFLNKKQPFSKLKNLIPTSKYKTLRLTGYSWGITDPNMKRFVCLTVTATILKIRLSGLRQ